MKPNTMKNTRPFAGLALAIAVGAQLSLTAQAQDIQQSADDVLNTMTVTGSNIPTAESVGPAPVQTISRQEIENSSYANAEQLIKNIPAANTGGVPISNNATGFTPGASSISLRGLGPDATLVLINGKRVATYPTGQGGNTAFVDLNTIPAAAIDSIDILTDGASTLYGADAVAGVVNIKLRKNYEGVEVSTRVGNTTDDDSSELSSSLVFGSVTETTSITGVVSYYHRNSIFNKDRDYSMFPPFQSSNSQPGNFRVNPVAAEAVVGFNPFFNGGSGYATPVGSSTTPGLNQFGNANVWIGETDTVANGFVFNNSEANPLSGSSRPSAFNFNSTSGSFPELEKYGSIVDFEHKIAGDAAVLYGTASYAYNYSRNELAPSATGNFTSLTGQSIIVPANSPGPIYTSSDVVGTPTGTPLLSPDSYNPFNPFQQELTGLSRYRTVDFGNRIFEDETDAVLIQGGIKGREILGHWGYDLGANYSRVKTLSRAQVVSITKFNEILDGSSDIFDPSSSNFIGTTTPYNPFFVPGVSAPNSPALIDYARVITKDRAESELWTIDAIINNPELVELPGGPIGIALGGQFRREQINQNPDQLNLDGDIIGNSTGNATNAGRKTVGTFGEVNIPIFGGDFTLPGFYSLEVNGSIRYEEVENTPNNVVVPKVGLRWQPIQDLTIRATYGKGYRQPSLFELYAPANSGLNVVTNPATGSTNFETDVITVGNPNLEPEDSEAFTAGFVYSPKFVPGLTLTAGWWQIERSGVVTAINQDTYDRFLAGQLLPGESVQTLPGGDPNEPFDIALVTTPYNNAGRYIAKGIDFGIFYELPTSSGTYSLAINATYLDSWKLTTIDGVVPLEEVSGEDSTGTADDAYLKWKGNASLAYNYEAFNAVATVNFIDGFEDFDADGVPFDVNPQTTLDLQLAYTFGLSHDEIEAPVTSKASYSKDGKTVAETVAIPSRKPWYADTTLAVGVRNLTDEKPPFASGFGGNTTGYPGFIYTSEGRFIYAQLTKKF